MIRQRKPIKRSGRPRSRSLKYGKPRAPWHPQVVRLLGQAMGDLRWQAFLRSGGFCEGTRADGKRCMKVILWGVGAPFFGAFEFAHIRARGKGGSDTLENGLCKCQYGPDPCHRGGAGSDHPGIQGRKGFYPATPSRSSQTVRGPKPEKPAMTTGSTVKGKA